MGTDERPPAGALIERLVERPQGFNLFQAISLLERAAPAMETLGEATTQPEAVRLSSVVSLGFQPSDIASVRTGSPTGEAFTLKTPVMTLAGADGPLPLPFTELVLERKAARDESALDFLDIFNHRLLSFFYRGRKKHHLGLNWASPERSSLAATLDALSALGLARRDTKRPEPTPWLRHAGLIGGAPRSMTGLFALLADRLGVKVTGRQFIGGWHRVEHGERARLASWGSAPRLGLGATLGARAWYQGAGIELQMGPLGMRKLAGFLPHQPSHALTRWLVERYVQQEMRVDLVLAPAATETPLARLGASGSMRLGWTAWLRTRASDTAPPPARLHLQSLPRAARA